MCCQCFLVSQWTDEKRTYRGRNAHAKANPLVTSGTPDPSRRLAEIRAELDRQAGRTLRARLIQLPLAIVLVGGLIFAMAAGGAFNHHQQTFVTLQNATSSRAGGILGLKIDAALTALYLIAILVTYALRRLTAPNRARRLLEHDSVT